tara:strand:- start:1258 stop:1425 length:168 start_codon:yes stop_codon:yes gene_type:complete
MNAEEREEYMKYIDAVWDGIEFVRQKLNRIEAMCYGLIVISILYFGLHLAWYIIR